MEEELSPKRKGVPFSSPSRSKPYTKRRSGRVMGNWNGVYNILGLTFPALTYYQDAHTRLTNRVCESHGL
ncbi:hypothetical protein [Litchfieldella qijiaojingensis]|uniref:hypothetical protein n=1 Tax=Litchfieldella qijiaojingensis TaxID=980347 RepID=UPI001677ED44|nr:hypothetical protein [Halomonas qijiaojingensis]